MARSDLAIARAATLKPLGDLASAMGLPAHLLRPYGDDVAKVRLDAVDEGRRHARVHPLRRRRPRRRGAGRGGRRSGRLYPAGTGLREKIDIVARRVHGADGVDVAKSASRQLDTYERNGFGGFPVCIAKTHLSLSSDPRAVGAPVGWRLPVREVRASAGAGFVYPICGDVRTMPGLGAHPAAHEIDIDAEGNIVNLS